MHGGQHHRLGQLLVSRSRSTIAVGVLVTTALLLWWVPALSGRLYGPSWSERMPLGAVVSVVLVMAVASLLAWRLPGWARGAVSAVSAVAVVLLWPYQDFSEYGWVVLWSIYSGALFLAVAGGFLTGLFLGPRGRSVEPRQAART